MSATGTATVEFGAATCSDCPWVYGETDAVDQASEHHEATGHRTVAREYVTVRYGDDRLAAAA